MPAFSWPCALCAHSCCSLPSEVLTVGGAAKPWPCCSGRRGADQGLSARPLLSRRRHSQCNDCYSGYYSATLLLEIGWLQRAYHYATVWAKKSIARLKQLRHSQQGYEQTASDSTAERGEDEDVQEERLAVQAGNALILQCCCQSLLNCTRQVIGFISRWHKYGRRNDEKDSQSLQTR